MKAYRNAGLWLLSLTLFVALVAGCSKSKSDAQLASEVQSKIQQDFAVPNKQLGVAVANGVVTLNGNVASEMERAAAANDAGRPGPLGHRAAARRHRSVATRTPATSEISAVRTKTREAHRRAAGPRSPRMGCRES